MKPGTLYIVGTPIGNLGDLSPRAAETLKKVSLIAAEDTRRTKLLLNHFGIYTPLLRFDEYTQRTKAEELMGRLEAGEEMALVTDAGMPGISDPGAHLVSRCHAHAIPVAVVPGPSAVTAALALSGFPGDRFRFEGFPPRKQKALREWLTQMGEESVPVVCFESPYRLTKTLKALAEVLGEIPVRVAREMTKLHEETTGGSTSEVLARYTEHPPKGEVSIVFWPQKAKNP